MPPSLTNGSVLRARYRITQLLHQSRHADIYLVEDMHLKDRIWAMRAMPVYSVDPFERTRMAADFTAEAQRLSQLDHPTLAKVVDHFVEGNHFYIVREFVHGTDLEALLAARIMPMSEREALQAVSQILDAIVYLLGRKVPAIFFRELTAKNIILSKNGQVKLIDLGLARAFHSLDSDAVTRVGSLDYASPEQFSEHGSFDQRSLVYSAGAILYHMLTRRNPALSPFSLDAIEEVNPNVSPLVEELVHRATENEPRNRHGSLADLKKALQGALRGPRAGGRGRGERPATRDGWRVRAGGETDESSFDGSIWHWILVVVLVSLMSGALLSIYYFFFRV